MKPPMICMSCKHSKVCRYVNECHILHETINTACESGNSMFTAPVQCIYFVEDTPIQKMEKSRFGNPV